MSDAQGFPDPAAAVEPLLAVADLQRSLGFWRDLLGAQILVLWETYALMQIGSGRIHLALAGPAPPDRSIALAPPTGDGGVATGEVVLRVADCRMVVAELQQRGVRFLGPATAPAWGGEVRAFAFDPDGHLIEITSTDGTAVPA